MIRTGIRTSERPFADNPTTNFIPHFIPHFIPQIRYHAEMSERGNMPSLEELVLDLVSYPTEQEWFEFKESWYNPHALGEYISALSNAAALKASPRAISFGV